MMKNVVWVALVAVFALAARPVEAQIPNVKVENAKGEMIATASLGAKKKPMIVSFWSTTCKPCIVELNAMNDLLPDWKDEADFEIIAVSTDDQRSSAVARALVNGNGWDGFTVLYDKNQEFKRALNVNMIPHTFIFDANGKQIYSHVGYTPGTEEEYIKIIKQTLKK